MNPPQNPRGPLPLESAERMGAKVVAELGPFCERAELAGSIRRRVAWVNDIDVVVIPKPGLEAALQERVLRRSRRLVAGPQQIEVVMPNGVRLDVWIARPTEYDLVDTKPTNFGSLWLCRTGSREHNLKLIARARELSLTWNPYHGVFDSFGRVLACETEEEIFRALELEFVPPHERAC